MPVSIKDPIAAVYKIGMDDSLKDTLIEIERIFDANHLFAYRNWLNGVLCAGPEHSRHWVSVSFRWPADAKPDLAGAKRLEKIKVLWEEEHGTIQVQRESHRDEDLDPETGEPVVDDVDVYYIHFDVPRAFVSNVPEPANTGTLPIDGAIDRPGTEEPDTDGPGSAGDVFAGDPGASGNDGDALADASIAGE